MELPRTRIYDNKQRYHYGIMGAGIFILLAFLVGCQGADSDPKSSALGLTSPDASEAASTFAPPTLGELLSRVELAGEQLQPMETALERWSVVVQARHETVRTEGRRGKRGDPRRGGRGYGTQGGQQPPLQTFLMECAEFLEPEQLVTLVELLAERRDGHRKAFAGRRPDRPRGRHDGKRGEQFEGRRPNRVIDELDLTEQQQTALQEARDQSRAAIQALIEGSGGRGQVDEATREKTREIRQQMKSKLENILTPEQLSQLEGLRDERRAEMTEQREDNFTQMLERRVEILSQVLKLNETQRQQIVEILTRSHEQLHALRQNARVEDKSFADIRAEAERIRQESTAAIKEQLTAEQAAVFEALQTLLPRRGGPQREHRLGR